jgi:hypothetical protein
MESLYSMESGVIVEYDSEKATGTIEDEVGQQLTFHGVAGRLVGLKGWDWEPTLFVLTGRNGKPTENPLPIKAGDQIFFERHPDDQDYARVWGLDEARQIVLGAKQKLLRAPSGNGRRAHPERSAYFRLPDVPPLAPLPVG